MAASSSTKATGKLLGHRDVRSAARYAHLDDATVLEANQVVGDAIARMMGE